MKTKVIYAKNALKDLKKLEKSEAQQIVLKVQFYADQNDPLKYAKKLKPPFNDLYRFKIGSHRAVFDVDSKGNLQILNILKIAHRRDVYE